MENNEEMNKLRKEVQKTLQNFFAYCHQANPKGETRLVNYVDWGDAMIVTFIENGWTSTTNPLNNE
jgi:hypothetical protein